MKIVVQRSAPASVAGGVRRSRSRPMRCSDRSSQRARACAASRRRAAAPSCCRRSTAGSPPTFSQPPGIAPHEALVRLVLQMSALACALPWVRALALDPVVAHRRGCARSPPRAWSSTRSASPYPAIATWRSIRIRSSSKVTITLPDGTVLAVRPMRPEDAELERRVRRRAVRAKRATSASSTACTSSRRR